MQRFTVSQLTTNVSKHKQIINQISNKQKPFIMLQQNFENLSTSQLKSIALKQHLSETYFINNDTVYEGTEAEARQQFLNDNEDTAPEHIEQAFADYCNEELTEVSEIDGNEETNGHIVLTDDEADEAAAENIKQSLWAFNASFIIDNSDLPYEATEMVQNFQEQKCEGANDTIEALITDMEDFIANAITAEGIL